MGLTASTAVYHPPVGYDLRVLKVADLPPGGWKPATRDQNGLAHDRMLQTTWLQKTKVYSSFSPLSLTHKTALSSHIARAAIGCLVVLALARRAKSLVHTHT